MGTITAIFIFLLQAGGGTDSTHVAPEPAISVWGVLSTFIDAWFWITALIVIIGTQAIKEFFSEPKSMLDPRSTTIPPALVQVKSCKLSTTALKEIVIGLIAISILLKWWKTGGAIGPDMIINWLMTMFIVSLMYWLVGTDAATSVILWIVKIIPGIPSPKQYLTSDEYLALGETPRTLPGEQKKPIEDEKGMPKQDDIMKQP